METLSHKFLEALAPPRDRLYGLALARAGTPVRAEAALQEAAHRAFEQVSANALLDFAGALEKSLLQVPAESGAAPAVPPSPAATLTPSSTDPAPATPAAAPVEVEPAMPADVWARLAACVQQEAARSSSAGALAPDSQLLQPDPMLAPRKFRPRGVKAEYDTGSPKRLLAWISLVLLLGVAVTIYILTRPPGTSGPPPASRPVAAPVTGTP